MAAAEDRASDPAAFAGLTVEESSLLWQLAMRLPRCDSEAEAEAVLMQATAGLAQPPAFRDALAATAAAAIDAIRDRERLQTLAICDPLTGLSNRRFMEEELDRQIHAMTRLGQPMALALLDLDHFRRCNEAHGHLAGDLVLRSLAVLLQGFRRRSDVPCRYGGEEFVVIMPATSAADAALYDAKRTGRNRICTANPADFSVKNGRHVGR